MRFPDGGAPSSLPPSMACRAFAWPRCPSPVSVWPGEGRDGSRRQLNHELRVHGRLGAAASPQHTHLLLFLGTFNSSSNIPE